MPPLPVDVCGLVKDLSKVQIMEQALQLLEMATSRGMNGDDLLRPFATRSCSPVVYNLSSMSGFVCGECGERVCVFLCACFSVRLYVFMCMYLSLCACVRACVHAIVCVCVWCVCARVCCKILAVRITFHLCVCGNVKPCRLESTPGRTRERTPTRGHIRLNPPPPRATRG